MKADGENIELLDKRKIPTRLDITPEEMIESLKMISKYPDDLIIYPGHGEKTTLGYEKNNFKYYYNELN